VTAAPLPVVSPARCVACGDCVAVCPTHCLATAPHPGRPPWLARPLDCVSCNACALVCPADAIHLLPPETP